jgi:pectin methylesterase-like acyl-CoA thioesterase
MKAAKLVATMRDGSTKPLVLSTKANRWEQLLEVMEALPWVSIEGTDADNGVLGIVERDENHAWEDDEVSGDSMVDTVERLVKINMAAVAGAMQETRKMFADVLKAQSDVIASVVEAQGALSNTYQQAMRVQAANMAIPGGGEDDQVMKMMAMALMQKGGAMKPG